MAKLWDFLTVFWETLTTFLDIVIEGFLVLFTFLIKITFDGLLTIVYITFSLLDVGSFVFNASAAWTGMDDRIVWIINSMGLPTCMSILGAAYVLRFLINLIPAAFTRA